MRAYGEGLAALIDWNAILDGTDEKFRVRGDRTRFSRYAKETL